MRDVIGLLDCHNSPGLGPLTHERDLASTSFLGRYAFMDFALSNFCNSEIETVGILVRDHQRSILKHTGNMLSWVNNTKTGRTTIFYNERGQLNEMYNSDINNIKENDWVLYDSNASYIVFLAPHVVYDLDIRIPLEEHIARHEEVTIVYHEIEDADQEFLGAYAVDVDKNGYINDIYINDGRKKKAKVSLECWIVNRTTLADLIRRHVRVNASFGMKDMIAYGLENGIFKIHAYEHRGYARRFDSLKHYVDYSFELLDRKVADTLFLDDWPIYTLTHDTPPALYGLNSKVENSFISNGCIIEGEVKDSIICRNVRIGRGSKISRSILLSNVAVGTNCAVTDAVIDKYAVVTTRHAVSGSLEDPVYLKQGDIL